MVQAVLRDLPEGKGQRLSLGTLAAWRRQSLYQRYSQRPYVRGRIARRHGVAGNFDRVFHGENIRGLQIAVHQALAVQVRQRIRDRLKHVASFVRGERAFIQNFRQVLLGVLHREIRQRRAFERPSSGRKDADQVRMVEGGGAIPALDKYASLRLAIEHELDDGPARAKPGEEDRAPFTPAEKPLQRELSAGKFTFALFPIGHAQCCQGPRAWIFTTPGSSDFRFGLPHMAMSRASSVCSNSSMAWTPAEP